MNRAKKTGFLSTQRTIQGQSASRQESHLISSSLHVINLPAQCYCSAGHSSSFRERGIDQARTASVVHLCVLWANRKEWTKLSSVYNTSCACFFFCCALLHVCIYACLWKVNICIWKGQKQQDNKGVYVYTIVDWFAYWYLDGWFSWPYSLLSINTSLVRHPCLVAHIKKTGTKDEDSIVNGQLA